MVAACHICKHKDRSPSSGLTSHCGCKKKGGGTKPLPAACYVCCTVCLCMHGCICMCMYMNSSSPRASFKTFKIFKLLLLLLRPLSPGLVCRATAAAYPAACQKKHCLPASDTRASPEGVVSHGV